MHTITTNEKKVFPPNAEDLVTKNNFFTSSKNLRWYCHSDEMIPSRTIWRGNQMPTSLPYAKNQLDLAGIFDQNGESVLSYLEKYETDAFLVMHKGEIVYENYFNGYKPYELHAINSATKSFVGLIVNMIADEGLLDVNKKASYYITELTGTGLGEGTIQQLLDMQVPVKYLDTDAPHGIGRGTPIFQAIDAMPKPANYNGPENLYEFMLSSIIDKVPGTEFYYENGQTEALGWVVQRLTGKNMSELIQDLIWSKLGAEENAAMQLDPIGTDVSNCGMRATLRDLARFGEMMLNNGYYNGQQIIPEHIVKMIHQGDTPRYQKYLEESDYGFLPGFFYHNKWWVNHDQYDGYSARGRFDQQIYIAPKADTVVVKLSSFLPHGHASMGYKTIIDHLLK